MVDVTVENYEKEKGKKDHQEKVSDEDVVTTVAEILSEFCSTNCQLAITACGVYHFTKTDFRIVQLVASLELQEPWNVPNGSKQNHWDSEETS